MDRWCLLHGSCFDLYAIYAALLIGDICWVAFFRLTKIVQPRRRRSAPKKRPDSQSLSSIGVDDSGKSWKKSHVFFFWKRSISIVFFSRGHHESVGDLHPRFTRLTADTSKTSAVTCRGSPSRKPSRFVASQLHLLHLCISAVPFLSILHLSGRAENAGILGKRRCEATQLRGRNCFEIILNEKTKKLMAILKLRSDNLQILNWLWQTDRHQAHPDMQRSSESSWCFLLAQVLRTSSEKIPTAVKWKAACGSIRQHFPDTSRQLLNAISFKTDANPFALKRWFDRFSPLHPINPLDIPIWIAVLYRVPMQPEVARGQRLGKKSFWNADLQTQKTGDESCKKVLKWSD